MTSRIASHRLTPAARLNRPVRNRVLVGLVATVLAAGSLGCGVLNQAEEILGAAQVFSEFTDRLRNGATLTYTAEYRATGGETMTLVQQPPKSAYLAKSGKLIFTGDTTYLCGEENGVMTCQKSNNTSTDNTANAGIISGIAGPGFVTPQIALALILAAAVVPGAKVTKSEKKIAGQNSLCATASGLDAAADPSDTDAPKDFTVCVTDAGVLASFSGTSTNGETVALEMTSFKESADPSAFEPPAGAKIVEVDQIQVAS